jgi:hypothetical protein
MHVLRLNIYSKYKRKYETYILWRQKCSQCMLPLSLYVTLRRQKVKVPDFND